MSGATVGGADFPVVRDVGARNLPKHGNGRCPGAGRSASWGLHADASSPLRAAFLILSGQCVAVISLSLIAAFKTMPITTAIAIFFIEPLLLTRLAGVLLGEKPGPHRYAAIGIGMPGVPLILPPNFSTSGPAVFPPVAAAVACALNMIIARRATWTACALTFQLGAAADVCITRCDR